MNRFWMILFTFFTSSAVFGQACPNGKCPYIEQNNSRVESPISWAEYTQQVQNFHSFSQGKVCSEIETEFKRLADMRVYFEANELRKRSASSYFNRFVGSFNFDTCLSEVKESKDVVGTQVVGRSYAAGSFEYPAVVEKSVSSVDCEKGAPESITFSDDSKYELSYWGNDEPNGNKLRTIHYSPGRIENRNKENLLSRVIQVDRK